MFILTSDGIYRIEKTKKSWKLIHDGYGVIGFFRTKKEVVERLVEVYPDAFPILK